MTITAAEQVGQAALSGFSQYEAEIADLKRNLEYWVQQASDLAHQRNAVERQLEESQARESRLREALEFCRTNGHHEQSYNLACFALALPHDDTALREYRDAVIEEFVGKFKRHVGGDGEFWMHELEDFYQNTKAP